MPTGVDRVVAPGLGGFRWAQDSRHVLFSRDQGGNENYHLFALDTLANEPRSRDLTPFPGRRGYTCTRCWRTSRRRCWCCTTGGTGGLFDLYRLDIATGEETLVQRNPGDALGVVTDRAGQVVGAIRKQGGFGQPARLVHRPGRGARGAALAHRRPGHGGGAGCAAAWFLPDQQPGGASGGRWLHLDLATGQQRVVREDPDVDIDGVWQSGGARSGSGELLAALSNPGYQRVHALDAGWARDIERFFPERPRRMGLLSMARDERLMTVMVDTDTERRFLLLDRHEGRVTELGQGTANAYRAQLGVTRPVRFTARDGLPLHGYLTLPPGHERRAPGPMVLHVHGGPWARDY